VEPLEYAGVKEILTIVAENDEDKYFPPPLCFDDDSESTQLLERTIQDLKNRHKLYDPLEEGCE